MGYSRRPRPRLNHSSWPIGVETSHRNYTSPLKVGSKAGLYAVDCSAGFLDSAILRSSSSSSPKRWRSGLSQRSCSINESAFWIASKEKAGSWNNLRKLRSTCCSVSNLLSPQLETGSSPRKHSIYSTKFLTSGKAKSRKADPPLRDSSLTSW